MGALDFFAPDICIKKLKKKCLGPKNMFSSFLNTRDKWHFEVVLMVIWTVFDADTTRKSKFFQSFRADTSREIEDSVKKCCYFQTFSKKGNPFEFCEGHL